MRKHLPDSQIHRLRSAIAACSVLLGLSGAMAQTSTIEADATTRLAQGRSPESAVGRLLKIANNSAFECGTTEGWDAACLRQRYQGPPQQWPRPIIDAGKQWREMSAVPAVQPPANAREQAKLELGTALFFDAGLSRKGGVSCANCHQSGKSFTDGRAQAVGEDQLMGRRRAQP